MTMGGDRLGGVLGSSGFIRSGRDEYVNFETDEFVSESGESVELIISEAILDSDVLALNITEFVDLLQELLAPRDAIGSRTGSEPPNLRYLRLLLRLRHSPTYCKCDRDGDNSPPF